MVATDSLPISKEKRTREEQRIVKKTACPISRSPLAKRGMTAPEIPTQTEEESAMSGDTQPEKSPNEEIPVHFVNKILSTNEESGSMQAENVTGKVRMISCFLVIASPSSLSCRKHNKQAREAPSPIVTDSKSQMNGRDKK